MLHLPSARLGLALRWFRSHRRPWAWVALLALVLQLGLSFGHVHAAHAEHNVAVASAAGTSRPERRSRCRLLRDLRDPRAADRRADRERACRHPAVMRGLVEFTIVTQAGAVCFLSRRIPLPRASPVLNAAADPPIAPASRGAMSLRTFGNIHDTSRCSNAGAVCLALPFLPLAPPVTAQDTFELPQINVTAPSEPSAAGPARPAPAATARNAGARRKPRSRNAADRHRPVRHGDGGAARGNPAQPRLDPGRRVVLQARHHRSALRPAHRAGRSSAASMSTASASSTTASAAAASPTSAKTTSCRSIRWPRTRSR